MGKARILFGACFAMLSFAAQVGPDEAVSNVSKWLRALGLENLPSWILSSKMDDYVSLIALALALIFFLAAFFQWQNEKNGALAAIFRNGLSNFRGFKKAKPAPVGDRGNTPAQQMESMDEHIARSMRRPDGSIAIIFGITSTAESIFFRPENITHRAIKQCSYSVVNLQQWSAEHRAYVEKSTKFVPLRILGPKVLEPLDPKPRGEVFLIRRGESISVEGRRDGKRQPYSEAVRIDSIWRLTFSVDWENGLMEVSLHFKCDGQKKLAIVSDPSRQPS